MGIRTESTAWMAKGCPEFVFTLDEAYLSSSTSQMPTPSVSRMEESPLLPVTAMQPTRSSLLWLLLERQSVMVVGGRVWWAWLPPAQRPGAETVAFSLCLLWPSSSPGLRSC